MSSNPFHTCPGLMERGRHLIHLCLPNNPMALGYQFLGHESIDGAYGNPLDSGVGGSGPSILFQVDRGLSFRSASLRRSNRGQIVGNIRGQTHVAFDLTDFAGPSLPIPLDEHWLFLRVRENRNIQGLLSLAGVPTSTVTLAGVLATDQITIKGIVFEFAAGANDLVGKAGTAGDPFIVGLGADDNAAAANLTLALNDAGDVGPAMDVVAPLNTHTFGDNPGAPAALVAVQPENATPALIPGNAAQFSISTSDPIRLALDAQSALESRLVWSADGNNPVMGPIYCLPPVGFFGIRNPAFTLAGTAPANTGDVAGDVPLLSADLGNSGPRALHLAFPRWLTEVAIRNNSLNELLVSFGVDQPLRSVPAGDSISLTSGKAATKEILLASAAATGAEFAFHAVAASEM